MVSRLSAFVVVCSLVACNSGSHGRADAGEGTDASPGGADADTREQISSCGQVFTCDRVVPASLPASIFNLSLTTPGVVCLDDGVVVNGAVGLLADDITIVAADGAHALLVNAAGDVVDVGGHTGVALVGLTIDNLGGNLPAAVSVGGDGDATVLCSTVGCESNNCYLTKVEGGSLLVRDSELLGGVETANYSYGAYAVFESEVAIHDTVIASHGCALSANSGADVVVTGSTLSGLNPLVGFENAVVTVYSGVDGSQSTLALSSSTVRAAGFSALKAKNNTIAPGVTVTLDGNQFRKIDGTPAGEVSPFLSNRSDTIFHSQLANTFCNEGSAVDDGSFSATLIAGPYDETTSTFDDVTHVGPIECSEIDN
jgi:hypothetical protein